MFTRRSAPTGPGRSTCKPSIPAPTGPSPTSRSATARDSPSAPTSASPAHTDPPDSGNHQPVATVDDYEVTLATERGDGGEVIAALSVRQNGELVEDLEPYLGADGHLVAMRAGDLAYAHVHPIEHHGDDDNEPAVVRFNAELSSAGRYGLFFDFQHDGIVRTASFTFDQSAVTGAADMEH